MAHEAFISEKIQAVYERYIQPPEVIILNVISAVTDVKANESVLLAHQVSFQNTDP